MVGEQDEVGTAAGSDGELTHAVVVGISNGLYLDIEFFVLGGADKLLVVKSGVPKQLGLMLLPRFRLSGDQWVVFFEGGIVLVKRSRYPWLVFVDHIGEYKAGYFAIFQYSRADRDTRPEEEFLYFLEVIVPKTVFLNTYSILYSEIGYTH